VAVEMVERRVAVVPLVTIDAVFLSANLLKLFEGAWLPVLFGAAMVLLIVTGRKVRAS